MVSQLILIIALFLTHTMYTSITHLNSVSLLYYLNVIYHPLYGMNNYVLIWGDWLSCDPHRGSHDSQSTHIWGDWLSCDPLRGSHDKETLVPHLVATLIYLSQNYSYYIRDDRSPLLYIMSEENV